MDDLKNRFTGNSEFAGMEIPQNESAESSLEVTMTVTSVFTLAHIFGGSIMDGQSTPKELVNITPNRQIIILSQG